MSHRRRIQFWLRFGAGLVLVLALLGSNSVALHAQDVSYALPDVGSSISVSSDRASRWQSGQYEVLHLSGSVKIQQERTTATADEAIVWVETPGESTGREHKVLVYLEGRVTVEMAHPGGDGNGGGSSDRIVDEVWFGRFYTTATVDLDLTASPLENGFSPAIYSRAQSVLENGLTSGVQPAGFTNPVQDYVISPQTGQLQQINPNPPQAEFLPPPLESITVDQFNQSLGSGAPDTLPGNFSPDQPIRPDESRGSPFEINVTGRDSTVALNSKTLFNPDSPNERISILVGGIRMVITSPQIYESTQFQADADRNLYILADNLVNWQVTMADGSVRNQFYLEGNVVFAKGSRVIYSERMFYDVDTQQGTILKAEMLTTVPSFRGTVRLKADVIRQLDDNNLQAFGSAFTSSRMGVPRYWLQSEEVNIKRTSVEATDPDTMDPIIDSYTGMAETVDEFVVDSRVNRVYMYGVPVFAWPRLKTSLNDPTLYLDRLGINNDKIFGFQVTTGWNLYQVLGLRQPTNGSRRWIGVLDYLSKRGLGYGSEFDYQMEGLLGIPGHVKGEYRSWFIRDTGLDTIGLDRRDMIPEEKNRGHIWAQHRQDFSEGHRLRGELGYISDRDFLEQYFEREWDTRKDATTGVWLEKNSGTRSRNLTADYQVNDFFTQTSGINLKHFVLGQQVFNSRAIWHSHSQVGYVRMRVLDAPTDPGELAKFDPLAWEADVDGLRVGTRNELDFPVQVGPVKFVPYLLGDATYWQEDLNGNEITRLYGQVGIRASLPFWRVDPSIQSTLWNVNGLAHKVTYDFDAFAADASKNLDEFPLYDQLDDDSQEHFRRRFAFDTFGIMAGVGENVPLRFDERYFALRSGMQGNITAPSTEIADDLALIKFGIRQRWQTKRGLPGRERIIDWITFDVEAILYPNEKRDNFGSDFGMFDYDFRWHVGDRVSLVSDGYFDFFSQGLRTASFGANLGRPEIGNAYIGYRMIEGPISSNILSAALTYRMSKTWGVKAGGQVDFGATGTIGQNLSVVYIGESFLWNFGVNHNVSRGNYGFRFGFEPRFASRPRMFRPGGTPIEPAGTRWLE